MPFPVVRLEQEPFRINRIPLQQRLFHPLFPEQPFGCPLATSKPLRDVFPKLEFEISPDRPFAVPKRIGTVRMRQKMRNLPFGCLFQEEISQFRSMSMNHPIFRMLLQKSRNLLPVFSESQWTLYAFLAVLAALS